MKNYIRLVNTVKYLKSVQICYRLYYLLRARWRRLSAFRYSTSVSSRAASLTLHASIPSYTSYTDNTFTFLSLSQSFECGINWNHSEYGKLWTYNLTYFDFLNQQEMTKEVGKGLIDDFIDHSEDIKDGMEPFPISLRGINWIKFLTHYEIQDQKINDTLYAQYGILSDNLEYHLLGNHLLENGFSLLFGAYYFQDEKLYIKAKEILEAELLEQVLGDGAHFELSPMYHQIMLFRVLDCINLIQNNSWMEDALVDTLHDKAAMMLGWLNNITYANGDIPLLNDSANKIAPTTKQLNDYAASLRIEAEYLPLRDSGYRRRKCERYECIVDVGQIGPDYIPGHAHSDTFNFELYVDGKPLIVDTGTSTYETNARRMLERSTVSHNTVELEGQNQSEVWGGFRVAERAYIVELEESDGKLKATHDGYKKRFDALHEREFVFDKERICITDKIVSSKPLKAVARIHFHPSHDLVVGDEGSVVVVVVDEVTIRFKNHQAIELGNYSYAPEFNTLIVAKVIEVYFSDYLECEIQL